MKLTAYPFDANTGELLPVYRDAYLRGDLSQENTQLVDAYLKKDAQHGSQTWQRFHTMQQDGEQVEAVGWMQRQLNQMQTSPQRMRRQVAGLAVLAALVGGSVFAATSEFTGTEPVLDDTPLAVTSTTRMSTLSGRILDENGHALVGATVFEKGSTRGVTTNADGEYTLAVPTGRPTTLAYGYGGYSSEEIAVSGNAHTLDNMTLVPQYEGKTKPARKAKRWFFFN